MNRQLSAQANTTTWNLAHILGFFGVIVLIAIVIIYAFSTFVPPVTIWLVLLALFVALTVVISHAYTGRWLGILIDERNKYSLSRLQMAMWTVMILAAFTAAVLANVQLELTVYVSGAIDPPQVLYGRVGIRVLDVLEAVGVYDRASGTTDPNVDLSQLNLAETLRDGHHIYIPLKGEPLPDSQVVANLSAEEAAEATTTPLSVRIPNEVWVLLGISTTSLVAAPLIKTQKQDRIQANTTVQEAKLSDFFRGEEGGDFLKLDLSKVQMFYFTVIVIGAYAVALANVFTTTQNAISSLPTLDGGVVALLGVSHAGYLTSKAVPKSDAAPQPAPEAQDATPLMPGDDQGAAG